MHQSARLIPALIAGALLAAGALLLSACEEPKPEPKPEPSPAPVVEKTPASQEQLAAVERFRNGTVELLKELESCSAELLALGNQFLEQTKEDKLDALKTQWQLCFNQYQASTVLMATNPEQQTILAEARSRLGNPLTMPGFIDSVEEYPYSGIVNDASLPLDAETLRQQHGITDEAEVSIGFDVVAFLLWGEHRQQQDLPPRPVSDYESATSWEDGTTDLPIEEHPNNRRRRLLGLTLELLAADCQALVGSWQSGGLPDSQEAFTEWRQHQLQALADGLSQQPENTVLRKHLINWIRNQVVPGVELDELTEDAEAEALLQRLSGAEDIQPAATTGPG